MASISGIGMFSSESAATTPDCFAIGGGGEGEGESEGENGRCRGKWLDKTKEGMKEEERKSDLSDCLQSNDKTNLDFEHYA